MSTDASGPAHTPDETGGRPRPDQLWRAAFEKFPDDQSARRVEYIRLMREHGHLLPTLDRRPRTIREFFRCDGSDD